MTLSRISFFPSLQHQIYKISLTFISMKNAYLIILSILSLCACKPDKKETPEPAPKVLGFHMFSNAGVLTDIAYCDNGKVMLLVRTQFASTSAVKGVDENANPWFDNDFANDSAGIYFAIAEAPDNGVLLAGRPNSLSQRSMNILHFDKNAQKKWLLPTAFSDNTGEPMFILRLHDGNYVGLDSRGFSSEGMRQFFTWFNADGNVLRMKQVDVNASMHWLSIVEAPDNGYLCTGQDYSNGSQICVAKFSEQGDLLWKYARVSPRQSVGRRSLGLPGGELLTVGHDVEPGAIDYVSGVLTKIGANGDLLWEKRFTENTPVEFFDIIDDGKGGYLITGYGEDPVTQVQGRVMLLSVSADGTEQWRRYYDVNGTALRAFRRPDGGYMVIGEAPAESKIFVLITDKDGNIE
jgi:hypothetical protein